MKHFVDMAMGVLYLVISISMLKMPSLVERFGKNGMLIFMSILSLYGIYRIGRGFFGIKNLNTRDKR
ncbi:MAG: hypothetical protein IPJ31_13130 [Bacteroidetes bacterium]|nr:hypothetical protein [Bacteroidota bacterium]